MPFDAPTRFAGIETRLRSVSLRLDQVQKTPRGPPGPQGPQGDIGPMPKHEWRGTELRFEQASGKWGQWVDLQGPAGKVQVFHVGGGGGGAGSTQVASVEVVGGFAPTRVRAGKTFTVPEDTQVLFSEGIEVEGFIDIEGMLIEVD
jgi:hypothetical protein